MYIKFIAGPATSTVVALLALTGCARSSGGHTVDYYMMNDAQREAKLRECANDPGALRDDALCINAQKAGAAKAIGSLREPPSMSLVEAQQLREQQRQND